MLSGTRYDAPNRQRRGVSLVTDASKTNCFHASSLDNTSRRTASERKTGHVFTNEQARNAVVDAQSDVSRLTAFTSRIERDRERLAEELASSRTRYAAGESSIEQVTAAQSSLSALEALTVKHTTDLAAARASLQAATVAATRAGRLAELVSLAGTATTATVRRDEALERIGAAISAELPTIAGHRTEHGAARARLEAIFVELGAQRPSEYGTSEQKGPVEALLIELLSLADFTELLSPPVPAWRPKHGDKQHPGWPVAFLEARGQLDRLLSGNVATFLPPTVFDERPLTGAEALEFGRPKAITADEALEISRRAHGGQS